jgi:hypothetical protein
MMFHLEVILLYLPEGTEENHREPQSEYSVSQLKFEPGTSRMQIETLPLELSCSMSWGFSIRNMRTTSLSLGVI